MANKDELFGALICCTSGGVFKPSSIKKLIDSLSLMGYNALEICMEDMFDIDGEPYFGYLRGSYSKEELNDLVEYGERKGVELIPCIQTLAHLPHLAKLPPYSDLFDVDDILMIGDPRVYSLIEKMFKTMRECFHTSKINIGFDEAYLLGLGKYLRKNGFKDRLTIMIEHLQKVAEIAKKYGFKPHMWSDMFFRLTSTNPQNGKCGDYSARESNLPSEIAEKMPQDISLVYWDYFTTDEATFDKMATIHESIGVPIWFAGSAIVHDGFAPLNHKSLEVMEAAFKALRKHSINNFLITMWGDDGNECSFFSALPSLYAIRRFRDGVFDLSIIKAEFKKLFNVSFDDMMLLDIPNQSPRNMDYKKISNPCKSLLYNDPFLGWKDYDLRKEGHIDFKEKSRILLEASTRVGEYGYLFKTLSSLCVALSFKAELGIKTRDAYKRGDKVALKSLLDEYQSAYESIKEFHSLFKKQWLHDNKPFGYEVHEARLGGLESRVLDCKERIEEYLDGKVESIPELEKEILEYYDWGLQYNNYCGLVTVGKM